MCCLVVVAARRQVIWPLFMTLCRAEVQNQALTNIKLFLYLSEAIKTRGVYRQSGLEYSQAAVFAAGFGRFHYV